MPGDEACAMLVSVLAVAFTLMSSQFVAAGALPATASWNHDGCTGTNRSPALHWISPPVRAKAFALSVYDPDAGSAGWWHWIVYDIPIQQHGFATALSATAPHVKQGINDFGMVGYGGPCPPPGPAHHYVFTLYALNVAHLYASSRLRGSAFMQLIRPHIVGTATLTGIYGR
jgi:Raf kinase inhibitor-like YbhB/YbcL family protein